MYKLGRCTAVFIPLSKKPHHISFELLADRRLETTSVERTEVSVETTVAECSGVV